MSNLTSAHEFWHPTGTKMKVGEFLTYWLQTHGHNLRPATKLLYQYLIDVHIIPGLGAILLPKLAPAHLTAFYADRRERGRLHSRGGLSARTVRHLHAVIREALAWAVKHQLLARNVADAIDAPTFGRKEMVAWTTEEAQRFLIAAEGHRYGPLWLIYLATGMRRGEALGLRWRDLDTATGRLTVAQSVVVALNSEVRIQEPKTASSRRAVKLSASCLAALREHRTRQLEQRLAAPAWEDNDLIFCQPDGTPHDPRSVGRAFELLQRKAGVRRIRLHDLRHTHATLLFNDGHNVKIISQRLGHRDVSITLNVYAHLAPDAQDAAASAIDRLLGEQSGDEPAAVN